MTKLRRRGKNKNQLKEKVKKKKMKEKAKKNKLKEKGFTRT